MKIASNLNFSDSSKRLECAVLIAGAGPVGLSLALDLGQQGIDVIVLDGELPQESSDRVRRANAINNRAMEYMRRLGIASTINKISAQDQEKANLDVAFVTSLVGYELARFVNAFESSPERPPDDLSPETYRRINQIDIEAILRELVKMLSSVRYLEGVRLDTLTQDREGVDVGAARLDNQTRLEIRASFLIGCDGGSSCVRKLAHFQLEGQGSLAQNLNITFSGDAVYKANRHSYASMYWIVNDRFDGYISASSRGGRLTLFDVDDARFASIKANPLEVISAAVGRQVEVEPVSFDRWKTHSLIAHNYRRGRIFLAGDAAHMHPPTGGLGMNTGLGDTSNLGWKLNAFLKGWAGEIMLDSYDAERRPVGTRVVAQSNHQYNQPASSFYHEDLDRDDVQGEAARQAAAQDIMARKATEFYSRGLVLGQTYVPSPIVIADAGTVINHDIIHYVPTAQAGARLPHLYLGELSVYDKLHGQGYTLIVGKGSQQQEIEKMTKALAARQVPYHVLILPPHMADFYEKSYLLVRPDAHVAWRSNTPFHEKDLCCLCGFPAA